MAFSTDEGKTVGIIRKGEFQLKKPKVDLSDSGEWQVVAHNAHFEYGIWNYILAPRYGWPLLEDPKSWDCTLSRAAAANLPLALEKLGIALQLKHLKDMEGNRIMKHLSKPQKDGTFDEDPVKYERLYSYCKGDVQVECAADKLLPSLSPRERAVWELDLLINRRGIKVDIEMARAAVRLAAFYTTRLNEPLKELTHGFIDKASQVGAMADWLKSVGVKVPMREIKDKDNKLVMKETLDKQSLAELLADKAHPIPQIARTVIEIRQQVGKASTAKYQTLVDAASPADQRLRGTLQYHAAGTGRWGGRMFQPQNLPQGTEKDVETAIAVIKRDDVGTMDLMYDKPMETLSSCLRGVIIPGAGKKFLSGDYSSIEARMVFWLANDPFALARYRMGVDLYIDMAAYVYKREAKSIGPKSAERQLGKKIILGCGFGMGPIRFRASCLADPFAPFDPGEELAELAVSSYREKYKKVRDEWYNVERAAVAAVLNPGKVFTCCDGKVKYGMSPDRQFLVCKLPSGRPLRYYKPDARAEENKFGQIKNALHFWGEHPKTKQWVRLSTYGGALFENITQASARDVMVNGMLKCEEAEYSVVLTVHDELLTEVPDDKSFELKKMLALMCELPPWAKDFPVAAEGWEGKRYRK